MVPLATKLQKQLEKESLLSLCLYRDGEEQRTPWKSDGENLKEITMMGAKK